MDCERSFHRNVENWIQADRNMHFEHEMKQSDHSLIMK